LDGLKKATTEADGVIHLAFKHGLASSVTRPQADLNAIEAIRSALRAQTSAFERAESSGSCT
jgi:hypothetical protein